MTSRVWKYDSINDIKNTKLDICTYLYQLFSRQAKMDKIWKETKNKIVVPTEDKRNKDTFFRFM